MALVAATAKLNWSIGDGDGGTDGPVKTANTARDGTGTVNTIFTAGASGSIVNRVTCIACGTNVASVARFFVNNGSASSNQDNNIICREVALPETTSTEEDEQGAVYMTTPIILPNSYKLLVVIGTTVVGGWRFFVEGADF